MTRCSIETKVLKRICLGLLIYFPGQPGGVVDHKWDFDPRFKSEGMTNEAWELLCKEREAETKKQSQA